MIARIVVVVRRGGSSAERENVVARLREGGLDVTEDYAAGLTLVLGEPARGAGHTVALLSGDVAEGLAAALAAGLDGALPLSLPDDVFLTHIHRHLALAARPEAQAMEKEFLSQLIDSTVDAILAADVSGTVILFNPGAERVFGYSADEVVGKLHVDKLYPEGVSRQIMRMLRSQGYGGVGRLEVTRREVVTRTGDIVPVNMTASTIYEGGKEVATVGILSDLRERIRIEQRLLMAQEKLMVTEKQAVIAELAGAAAHELNQPLTSVTLYVEMMQRRMPADDVNSRAVQAIAREVERMAEIVKKIGRITRYETKQYVGGASILDLEKSSESGSGPMPGE